MNADTQQQIVHLNQQIIELVQQDRVAEAIALYDEVLEIQRRIVGEAHPDYANSLNSLGTLSSAIGDYTKADQFYREALAIRLEALGHKHPDVVQSAKNLCWLYTEVGKHYESIGDNTAAESLYRRVLELQKAFLG